MKRHGLLNNLRNRLALVICGILLMANILQAQTTNVSPDRGMSPGKSYSISDIETIGLYSGNLMFNVPLGALPAGRGGLSAGINLHYDSKMWDVFVTDVTRFTTTHDVKTLVPGDEGGWRYGYKYALKLEQLKLTGISAYCENGIESSFYPYKLYLVTPDGGKHQLYYSSYYMNENEFMRMYPDGRPACENTIDPVTGTISYYTTDGTFLRVDLVTDSDSNWENNLWTVYAPDGMQVNNTPTSGVSQRIKDRNGNYLDIIENATDSNYSNRKTTYLQDQLGRKVVIDYNAATDEDWIRSEGFNGADIITRVKWKNITVNKYYWSGEMAPAPLDPEAYENRELEESFRVVDKIYLPEQLGDPEDNADFKYIFDYNVDNTSSVDVGWGEVSKVTLPSGAEAEYSYYYDDVSGSSAKADYILLNRPVEKELTYNRQYDGSTSSVSETWSYTPTATYNVLDSLTSVTITAPDGSETTEHYWQGTVASPPTIPELTKGEGYKTETANAIVEKMFTSNIPENANLLNKANRYVKYEFMTIKDNSGSPTKTAIKEYNRDKNGNVTEVKEYDFVAYSTIPRNSSGNPNGLPSGISSSLKRITKTEYYNDTPDAGSTTYTDTESYHLGSSPRLLNLAKSMEVQNASATPQSRTELTYDYTSYSSNNLGGNLTQTKSWDSDKGGSSQSYSNPLTSGNSITTSMTYNSYGMPTQTTDANGVQTTVTYGCIDGQTSCGSNYSNLYPTKVETASNYSTLKRTATTQYDFYTGISTLATDVDNNVSTATYYDDLGRPTKVAAAVGTSAEIWTQTEYDDVERRVIVRSDVAVKGDGKKVGIQHFDQLGRVRLTRTLEDAATEDPEDEADGIKVQTRYMFTNSSGTGYTYQLTSNPYRAATSSAATSEESMGWTRSKASHTGRHSEIETFAGAALPQPFLTSGYNTNSTGIVQTDIDADRTLVTDQAGKQRISKSNALGQLTDVWEIMAASDSSTVSVTFPSQSIAYGYQTTYSY